jgi:hypothetical protein
LRKPALKLDFVRALTDDVGIIQHAKYSTPIRKEGYTTDDNARALIVCTKYLKFFEDSNARKLIDTYLSFLLHMQRADGKMHNYLNYNHEIIDEVGSEDCMGRTIWACGYCLDSNLPQDKKLLSKEVFDKAMKWASTFTSPRAKAFSIMGLCHYQKAYPRDQNPKLNISMLADQLIGQFQLQQSNGWEWFEPYLTYANARLPHSLFLAYEATEEEAYRKIALKSFKFLTNIQTINRIFVPIGNRGWYRKGFERALYDQQPIEASCTTEAALDAQASTGEETYLDIALQAFEWFLGKNTKGVEVYDSKSGSCCDGITPEGLNMNKGAEANLTYLQARLSLEEIQRQNPKTSSSA